MDLIIMVVGMDGFVINTIIVRGRGRASKYDRHSIEQLLETGKLGKMCNYM
jgi:hypothetical protein